MSREDATDAVARAERVYVLCERLIGELSLPL
jgi:hypothetical protein